ncbi:ferredoxin reductase [Enemella evansiae]|uniref:ferredoxin reductase n=1 Tax=Enemella evansiae TaxID=2016499 RepID=UPI001556081C|nr:ferredoxin reductase [Enemella evansiae]
MSLHQSVRRRRLVGGLRWLAESLATPLAPGDFWDLIDPLRPGAELRGRILAIRAETPDAATLEIQPGRDWLGHRPGQYVRLGVDVDGVRQHRAYSITSPVGAPTLTITVKAIPDGAVSNHLVRHARVGELVRLSQATGDFSLGDPTSGPVLFLTAGSGITPILGMLRNHLDELTDAVLLHSAPRPLDVIAREELEGYAAAGRLRLRWRHTATEPMLQLGELDALVPDWRDRRVLACGPIGLLDACEAHWAEHALGDRLHTERFRPAPFAAIGAGGTVSFTASGRSVTAEGSQPLLDAGEAAGIPMPSGCRMGICRGCLVPLRRGAVRDLRNGVLTTADEDPIHIQTCVSAAAGDCELDH